MKDNLAPEEKLLRLIKGDKKENPAPSTEKMQIALLPKIRNRGARQEKKQFIKFLPLAFALACAYLAVSFSWPFIFGGKIELPKIAEETATAEAKPESATTAKPLEYYLEQIRARKIFANDLAQQQSAEKPLSAAGADLIKGISLVGIISGEVPQVAIEDLKARRTYYVTKGQSVGELTIEEIKEGKVIIDYKGQKFELYL